MSSLLAHYDWLAFQPASDGVFAVSTYTGSFELRKLVVEWSRGPSGGTTEDRDMCTFHFLNITDGAPDATWTNTDYTTVETAFDALWTGMKVWHPTWMTLAAYKWFKSGPAWEPEGDMPYNPVERTTLRSVAGTSGASSMLPPQCAATVTERTAIQKRWGRFYWPAPMPGSGVSVIDANGRIATAGSTFGLDLSTRSVTFYNACRAAELIPVVWSRARSAYTSPAGNSIPAHAATAYSVDMLQVDNLWDVLRSRRYDGPTVRLQTTLT